MNENAETGMALTDAAPLQHQARVEGELQAVNRGCV
jgi:hypothetical protein